MFFVVRPEYEHQSPSRDHHSPYTCCSLCDFISDVSPLPHSPPDTQGSLLVLTHTRHGSYPRAFALAVLLPGTLFSRIAAGDAPSLPTLCSNVPSWGSVLTTPFKITNSQPSRCVHFVLFEPGGHATSFTCVFSLVSL